jgi:NAD(P)H-nitrite reductase large subunit
MHYGNLQKIRDGKRTYAITPDIPGGFVSAETLEKIAKVSKNGAVRGIAKGSTKITAVVDGKTLSCTVKVKK